MSDQIRYGKIAVIVHAPFGSSGDISGAANLIEILHHFNPDLLINFIIFVEKQHENKMMHFVPKTVHALRIIHVPPKQIHLNNGLEQAEDLLTASQGFILYATSRFFFANKDISSLTRYLKPVVLLSDYDRCNKGYDIIQTHNFPFGIVNLGLGPDSQGVFPPRIHNPSSSYPINKITSPSEIPFRDFLLKIEGGENAYELNALEKKYYDSRHLYFGFFNTIQPKHQLYPYSVAHPVLFVENCILHSLNKNQNCIDIVLPIESRLGPMTYGNNFKAVLQHLEIVHPDKAFCIEFYHKTEKDEIERYLTEGSGSIHVRIFNIFPIMPESFQRILEASQPYCLMVGNHSLLESFYHRKISMYQMMNWNRQFYQDILQSMVKVLGSKSYLAMYWGSQLVSDQDDKILASHKLLNILLAHEDQLSYECKKFKIYLSEQRNLQKRLPGILLPILLGGKQFSENCLKYTKYISMEYLCILAKIYPDSKASMLTYAVQHNCFQPFLLFKFIKADMHEYPELHSLSPNDEGVYVIKEFTQTFADMLKKNKIIDQILLENLEEVYQMAKKNDTLHVCLQAFIEYMLQREMQYQIYYPKLCRSLSKMRLLSH